MNFTHIDRFAVVFLTCLVVFLTWKAAFQVRDGAFLTCKGALQVCNGAFAILIIGKRRIHGLRFVEEKDANILPH